MLRSYKDSEIWLSNFQCNFPCDSVYCETGTKKVGYYYPTFHFPLTNFLLSRCETHTKESWIVGEYFLTFYFNFLVVKHSPQESWKLLSNYHWKVTNFLCCETGPWYQLYCCAYLATIGCVLRAQNSDIESTQNQLTPKNPNHVHKHAFGDVETS